VAVSLYDTVAGGRGAWVDAENEQGGKREAGRGTRDAGSTLDPRP
jgi:hypothetical protein